MRSINWWIIGITVVLSFVAAVLGARYAEGDVPFKPLNVAKEPLVTMILQEAANEPFEGLVGVAGVALDRVKDHRWPSTLRRVVYQRAQFTGISSPIPRYSQFQITRARAAAETARKGARPCGKVLWYHTIHVKPRWSRRLTVRCRLGLHIFYEDKKMASYGGAR